MPATPALLIPTLSRPLLFTIVFIEGYCSLGAEVIALRRLVPHMGSAIVVTAPTIGFFLLALALGYHAGGRVRSDYASVVRRNFFWSAGLCGVGLAGAVTDALFNLGMPILLAYGLFISLALCPVAYLLGQTVPVLTNLTRHDCVGEASGMALFWSTLGSFLGAASLSVLVMQWLGVSAAVLLVTALLGLGACLLDRFRIAGALTAGAILAGAIWLAPRPLVGETAYADYQVEPVPLAGMAPRGFWINKSLASVMDESHPPQFARYIQHLRALLKDSLGPTPQDILVLGAGGFTLSQEEPVHRYTYVDIDPAIRQLAEQHFLKGPARGEFVVEDARRYVSQTPRRFHAVVVDVYSNRMSIPGHLITAEFWQATKRVLHNDGLMVANLILDSRLQSPYARNLLATITATYGPCAVEVLQKQQEVANVEVSCRATAEARPPRLYRDERNSVDFDAAGMGR